MSRRSSTILRVFVYGTLKRGECNFKRFCGDATRIDEATVRGLLLVGPEGFPILEVPPSDVIAVGTRDYEGDAARPWATDVAPRSQDDATGWRPIRGEAMELPHGPQRLPVLDMLEDYEPDGPMWYRRVLVGAERADGFRVPAWVYALPAEHRGLYRLIEANCWSPR